MDWWQKREENIKSFQISKENFTHSQSLDILANQKIITELEFARTLL